jgi:hypothetical protein
MTTMSGSGRRLHSRQISGAQHLIANLDQELLPGLWDRNAFGICMSFDGSSQDGGCDTAANKPVTHHLIVKPVQNLP